MRTSSILAETVTKCCYQFQVYFSSHFSSPLPGW